MTRMRARFEGEIAGVGSTSGVRVVVGWWRRSPLGAFADAMVERGDGHRVLLAPNDAVAQFVSDTYTFDEVRIEGIVARLGTAAPGEATWVVRSPSLSLDLVVGRRLPLGWLLSAVPRAVATSAAYASAVDPIARVALRGVRTRGVARPGRREWYAATDLRTVKHLVGHLDGADLGALAQVDPPCRFGFSSTPRRPSVTSVVTTIETTGEPADGFPGWAPGETAYGTTDPG